MHLLPFGSFTDMIPRYFCIIKKDVMNEIKSAEVNLYSDSQLIKNLPDLENKYITWQKM